MKNEYFQEVLDNRLKLTSEVLSSKAEEYASDKDRMHNFKKAARLGECSPERALLGMMMKHIVSVLDLVDRTDDVGPNEIRKCATKEYIEEKIGDSINYLILLEAMLKERFVKN